MNQSLLSSPNLQHYNSTNTVTGSVETEGITVSLFDRALIGLPKAPQSERANGGVTKTRL